MLARALEISQACLFFNFQIGLGRVHQAGSDVRRAVQPPPDAGNAHKQAFFVPVLRLWIINQLLKLHFISFLVFIGHHSVADINTGLWRIIAPEMLALIGVWPYRVSGIQNQCPLHVLLF
jgi:hypothetical protein